MLENFEYFFYGCPGENDLRPMYALYLPITESFLICTTEWRTVNKLKMLLSSKYTLHLVELTSAKNYHHNIIDNSICENWSFAEKAQLPINELPGLDMPIYTSQLCASTGTVDIDWIKEKKYAMMCAHWIELFKPTPHEKFETEIARLLGNDTEQVESNPVKKQIMNLLYLGSDLKATDLAIKKLANVK